MDTILRWEYKVESIGSAFSHPKDEEIEGMLNEWGEEGWEIINVIQTSGSPKSVIVAKRPLSERERRRRSMPV